jgi:predicted nucleic acid-binding protein
LIVVDASVLTPALVSPATADARLRAALQERDMAAPGHLNLEVMSNFRKFCRKGVITEERAALALFDLAQLRIERVPVSALEPRIWELRHNLTTYDAAYVALAERFGSELWTFDRKLAGAPGIECKVMIPEFE